MLRALVIFLIATTGVQAFTPALNRVEPRGGQRGTEVQIELIGNRLFDPEEILFYRSGLKVKSLTKGKDPKKALAVIEIPADAPLGEYPLRLRCKEGLTHMRTFWVGQFPSVHEKRSKNGKREFNNTFEKPQDIGMNVTVQGVAQREDSDYYRVHCKKGQRLSVEVEGMRLARVMFDPYIAILDSDKRELASNDDSAFLGRDCAASVIIPNDGQYTIFLRESAYEGSSQAQYRLHVGHFPRPTWVYPPAGKPGDKLEITFHGDPTGAIKQTLTLPDQSFSPFPEHGGYLAPSGHLLRISSLKTINETEPNEGKKSAIPKTNPPSIPVAFHGILSKSRDNDWFRFSAKKGQKLQAQVFARSLGSPIDSVIHVRSVKTNKLIGRNDDATQGQPDSRLNFNIPESGEYLLVVRDQLNRSGADFRYRVEITPKAAQLRATLPTSDRNDDQKYKLVMVPRGNRLAIIPNITRSNIACDLDILTPQLPSGLSVITPHIPKKLGNFPLLFEATKDAPLSGGLYPFSIKDPKSGLTGPLQENIAHVKINNLGTYHATSHDLIAVAIIEKAPFILTLSAPPVPIVPKGVMALKVTAHREPDFDAPIKVTFPFKPPGIGAPNEVEIPKGKNEVTLTLNAKANVSVSDWQILVTATAQSKRGEVRVSSKFQPLKISEPYLDLSLEMAKTYPGQYTEMLAKLDQLKTFKGEATLTLHALPHGVTAAPQKITKDTKKLSIPLKIAKDARKGKHRNIFARVIIQENGHPIPHNLGHGGVLRINKPPTTAKK